MPPRARPAACPAGEGPVELIQTAIDVFLHLDKYLAKIIEAYGTWTYALLFVVVFCETGLVVTPFLPGDSLLFASGVFAAKGSLSLPLVMLVLFVAAVLGDAVNYAVGRRIGHRVYEMKDSRIFRKEYIDRTHRFFEKYGGKTIVIARFVPIVRTFAPFLAGVGEMSYPRFAMYNVTGALLWVMVCVLGGYFFGNLPFVRDNFSVVIIAIIVISVLPAVYEFLRHRKEERA